MRVLMIALVLSMVLPAAVSAQKPCYCENDLFVSCTGMRVSACPCGGFERIDDGCGTGVDYIEIIIRDCTGTGISGIPWTDYWMNACDPAHELCLCVEAFVADSLTGSNGRTTFSAKIAAGGCVPSGGIYVSCQGMTILQKPDCVAPVCLDVIIVSPDINADCFVNLSDLSFFGESYNKQSGDAGYNTCCDFNDDEWCNLSDFSFMGEHYLHECF